MPSKPTPEKSTPKSTQKTTPKANGEAVLQKSSGLNYPFWFLVGLLAVGILMTATATVRQTQKRHQTYADLSDLQKQYRKMHIEEQRLLIEQQTFSATPVVAKRAVSDLRMFYPDDRHRKVIAPPALLPNPDEK